VRMLKRRLRRYETISRMDTAMLTSSRMMNSALADTSENVAGMTSPMMAIVRSDAFVPAATPLNVCFSFPSRRRGS